VWVSGWAGAREGACAKGHQLDHVNKGSKELELAPIPWHPKVSTAHLLLPQSTHSHTLSHSIQHTLSLTHGRAHGQTPAHSTHATRRGASGQAQQCANMLTPHSKTYKRWRGGGRTEGRPQRWPTDPAQTPVPPPQTSPPPAHLPPPHQRCQHLLQPPPLLSPLAPPQQGGTGRGRGSLEGAGACEILCEGSLGGGVSALVVLLTPSSPVSPLLVRERGRGEGAGEREKERK